MCPLCMTSIAAIAAGSCTVGGVTAVLAMRLGWKKRKQNLSSAARPNAAAPERNILQGEDHDAHR
jgi:hypothetical protein